MMTLRLTDVMSMTMHFATMYDMRSQDETLSISDGTKTIRFSRFEDYFCSQYTIMHALVMGKPECDLRKYRPVPVVD